MKTKLYEALIKDCTVDISLLANTAAFIYQHYEQLNWSGFYLYQNDTLYLGPFVGKVACEIIPIGQGVCGCALAQNQTLNVSDVHQFPGHIACDENSKSELVIPIYINQQPFGVLDIDAPILNRFSEDDQREMQQIVELFISQLQKCTIRYIKIEA